MADDSEINDDELLLEIARLIRRHGISIDDVYRVLGVDLDDYRVDPGDAIATLSGILRGWENPPEE